ncbi:sigma-E factor regulatory protein RseB domain-containing protein [uncultured Brevibacillus sp.]|uniref:sigma-E factor regulatory protein RseB domain-containing protein n=1 Tax=uncultured Brevibacillus sp. TaxID=169970 RepID=UPI00259AB2A9|nr:sigma-E factor regulatory protein RseB domain-containing protein [uncultured Brevibacillus sp.]
MKHSVTMTLFLAFIISGCTDTNAINDNHSDQPIENTKMIEAEVSVQRSDTQQQQINKVEARNEQETIYRPPIKEENYNDMTKKEVLTKLLNTVDHFDTAMGKFELLRNGKKVQVEYQLSLTKMSGGFSKVTIDESSSKDPKVQYIYYKDGILWRTDEKKQSYDMIKYSVNNKSESITPEEAFSVDSEGNNVTTYRERPPIGLAQVSLFPYELASNYTRVYGDWEVEKQNEDVLGHNTIVLKGTLNNYASIKQGAKTFRFWVDKDTGILIKYELYDENSVVVNYMHSIELQVNVPIDTKEFEPKTAKLN